MTTMGVWQKRTRTAADIAAASRDAMTRALHADAELEIAFASDEAFLLGAFQRAPDAPAGAILRGTPGCAVRVGPGTLHVLLALARLEIDESKILNRHARPLLRAIGGRYFGRDWIDVGGRPVAHVGFAHERATGRTVVEAFVAVRTPFAVSARPSYLGKAPATLAELRGEVDEDAIARAVIDAYGLEPRVAAASAAPETPSALAWAACVDEAIGPVCAGRDETGRMRVGGEWMASFDAVRDLEDRLARREPVRAAIDAAFAAPHTALFGVRSLESFAHALEAAFE